MTQPTSPAAADSGTPPSPDPDAAPESIHSLRDELLRLRQQHQAGELEDTPYQSRKSMLERRLLTLAMVDGDTLPLARAPVAAHTSVPRHRPGLRAIGWAAASIAVLCTVAWNYGWLREPGKAPAGWANNRMALPPNSTDAALMAAHPGTPPAQAASAPHALAGAPVQAMVAKLAARLQTQPGDAEGWAMLGRSYMALGQPAQATEAYARALDLNPSDAATLADQADAWAAKSGRSLEGEPSRLIERALQLEPGHLKALVLAGTAAFNRADYARALQHWDRAVQVGPADHPLTSTARDGATQARQRLTASAGTAGAAAVGAASKSLP